MLETLENKVFDNFFTEEEINSLYTYINNSNVEVNIQEHLGYKWWPCGIPENLSKKITEFVKENFGMDLELTEVCLARYELNEVVKPNLFPHLDNFDSGRITIDIQIKSNINWAIVVEGNRFVLKDNQALSFAGTHQVHWREKLDFKDGDFVEMLFCHFTVPETNPISKEERYSREKTWSERLEKA